MSRQAEDAAPPAGERRIALLIEYDGSAFAGSQLQTNARTVQGVLEDAILKASEGSSRVAFAGRTDAGVHAWGQVASLVTGSALDTETLQRALNAWLPEDVTVRDLVDVELNFDPRRDARRRAYRYVIENSATRPALHRGRVWHLAGELEVEAMAEAARGLTGCHDFAAFASRLEDEAASTVRELYCFEVASRGLRIVLDVEANAFLPHQVRRMIGALVEVGRGKMSPGDFVSLLDGAPSRAGPAAPPHGLYLMRVDYEAPLFATLDSEGGVC
jgi:tRNA pseudouridine38-40 synthase